MGPEEGIRDYSKEGHPSQGLIMRSVRYLFQKMLRNSNSLVDFYINASFIEIYNEQIIDLLSDKKHQSLGFRYNKEDVAITLNYNTFNPQGFYIPDLELVNCTRPEEMFDVIRRGVSRKKMGRHKMNKDSSRSHTIFTVYIIR